MKKYSWIVALLIALSLAFIGCPGDSGGGGDSNDPTDPNNPNGGSDKSVPQEYLDDGVPIKLTHNQYNEGNYQFKIKNDTTPALGLSTKITTGDIYVMTGTFAASRATPMVQVQLVCDKWEQDSQTYTGHNKITGEGLSVEDVEVGEVYELEFTFTAATADAYAADNNTLVFQTEDNDDTKGTAVGNPITLYLLDFSITKKAD